MSKNTIHYFFIAGETSGDIHGGKLITAIKIKEFINLKILKASRILKYKRFLDL